MRLPDDEARWRDLLARPDVIVLLVVAPTPVSSWLVRHEEYPEFLPDLYASRGAGS